MDKNDLQNYAFRLVSRREYSVYELRQKLLKRWDGDEEVINNLIKKFIQEEYLSDERYAGFFVEQKLNINKWGKRKIFLHLRQKGIGEALAEQIWNEKFGTGKDELETACKLAKQKWTVICAREADPWKRKQKLQRFLVGRGFGQDIIRNVISDTDIKM